MAVCWLFTARTSILLTHGGMITYNAREKVLKRWSRIAMKCGLSVYSTMKHRGKCQHGQQSRGKCSAETQRVSRNQRAHTGKLGWNTGFRGFVPISIPGLLLEVLITCQNTYLTCNGTKFNKCPPLEVKSHSVFKEISGSFRNSNVNCGTYNISFMARDRKM
jgi:hypothetical protein